METFKKKKKNHPIGAWFVLKISKEVKILKKAKLCTHIPNVKILLTHLISPLSLQLLAVKNKEKNYEKKAHVFYVYTDTG